ncbi:MAG: hypothetical protein CM15mP75_2130 [Flammeovirgaceae bacterium]|nr:MAG: hypothetical protein CM15mP75_2130 [Flammeovirgaceae bacterium]
MDFGVAVPTIDSSVSMRILSSFKETRRSGEKIFLNQNQLQVISK